MEISAELLREIERYFHAEIPLTRAMAVRVVAAATSFAVEAPVASNSNHLRTAFGGSINSVATLAGYGYLWLLVRGSDVHIVVRESSIRFSRPAHEIIRAVCVAPDATELETFVETLRRNGRACITLGVRVEEAGELAAEFTGTFVARRNA